MQTQKIINVLFLCTGNSARSIMAEGLLNHLGEGKFHAMSAGSHPTGKVNPFALVQLQQLGHNTDYMRSKSWDEFGLDNAPTLDIVITVCDNAAGEVCPVWYGTPVQSHWGFSDPASATGSEDEKHAEFNKICKQIRKKIESLIALPIETYSATELKKALNIIGAQPNDSL